MMPGITLVKYGQQKALLVSCNLSAYMIALDGAVMFER